MAAPRTPKIAIAETPPLSPLYGDLWWSTTNGQLFLYYDDGNTQQWVVANRSGSGEFIIPPPVPPVSLPVVDVRSFGATGAPGQDAYPPIQAAIAFAQSIGGATVLIPGPGTFSLKTGELVVTAHDIGIEIGQAAVLEQATYGRSTIQIRNANKCRVTGAGTIRNPVTKTPISGPNYDGQAARQRACGVYAYEANELVVDGLRFENMFLAISLRPADPLTTSNRGTLITNIYSTHHDFGILTQAQNDLVINNIRGYITDLTQPSPNLPPHTIYISYNGNDLAPKSRNLSITNVVDEDNQFSSSIKVKHSDGVFMSGCQSLNVARGFDINADNFVMVGPQVNSMVDIGDSQQGGIVLLECNNGEIISPIVTLPAGNDTLEAITSRAPSSNIVVRGGRLTSNRAAPSASSLVRLNGGSGHKFIGVMTESLGAASAPYRISATATDCAIIRPDVKHVTGNPIAIIDAGAIRAQIELDIQTLNFTEANASIVNAGTDTLVAYSGKLPTRSVATLPDPAVYADTQMLLGNGAGGKPLVVSRNSVWWYPDGATVQANAEALAWQNRVIALGGTVSAPRFTIVANFITAEKAAGTWYLTDDYYPMWGENVIQAGLSLKRRVPITLFNAPVFTIDRGWSFNGTTQYADAGFTPSLHASAMTGADMSLSVYEVTNVASNGDGAGTTDTSTRTLYLIPRSVSNGVIAGINCNNTAFAAGMLSSLGLTMAQHTPAPVFESFKDGVSLGVIVPTTPSTSLPTRSLFIGARNNAGVASSFRAASIGFVCFGASLSGAQATAQYNNIKAWATAVGAP
jgi:hypothetical protein